MSKAKELRTSPENNINVYELLSLFGHQKKSKYTELLLNMMKKTKDFQTHIDEIKKHFSSTFNIPIEEFDQFEPLTISFFNSFISAMFNEKDLKDFQKFCEYNERGLIKQNDLTRYKDFEEVFNAMSLAEMGVVTKELEKQVKVVVEDEDWLVLRPLTFEASKKYGQNTKWCTTTENYPEHYKKYTDRGVLIYTINKTNGYKVAAFNSLDKNEPEFSWWNQKDTRIDSLQAEIPTYVRDAIFVECTVEAKTNAFLSNKLKDNKGPKSSPRGRIAAATERAIAETDVREEPVDNNQDY